MGERPEPFAGAVLAGGASSRLGRDKALVEIGGVTLVELAVASLTAAGAAPVSVVGGDEAALERLGLRAVPDRWPGRGPLGGILTAFGWSPAPIIAVIACDLPFVDASVLRALRATLDEQPGGGGASAGRRRCDAAIAGTDRLEPMCAVWRVEPSAPVLRSAFDGGERAVHRAVRGLSIRRVPVHADRLLNVNTAVELARAEERSASSTA